MRLKNMSILFLVVLLPISCVTNSSPTSENSIEIDIYKHRVESVKVSDLIKNIEFIQLSTGEGHMIGEITKIIKTDAYYFILDKKSNMIFAFYHNGDFQGVIGSKGNGPGEYMNPIDFTIDRTNEEILILDEFRKLIKTDYNGNLLNEQPLPQNALFIEEICFFDGYLFASTGMVTYNEIQHQIIRFDESLNIADIFLPFEMGLLFVYSYKNKFFISSDELFYVDPLKNIIYGYNGNLFDEVFNIITSTTKKSLEEIQKDPSAFFNNQSSGYLFKGCIAGDNILFLPVFTEGKPHYGFLNLQTNSYFLVNRIIEGIHPFTIPRSYYHNRFISFRNSYDFEESFQNSNIKVQSSDNPVIIEYEICLNHFSTN